MRSDSPSQFDELDIDEHPGGAGPLGAEEDFGELNEFEEQCLEPHERKTYDGRDLQFSLHPQAVSGTVEGCQTVP